MVTLTPSLRWEATTACQKPVRTSTASGVVELWCKPCTFTESCVKPKSVIHKQYKNVTHVQSTCNASRRRL